MGPEEKERDENYQAETSQKSFDIIKQFSDHEIQESELSQDLDNQVYNSTIG